MRQLEGEGPLVVAWVEAASSHDGQFVLQRKNNTAAMAAKPLVLGAASRACTSCAA